MNKVVLSHYITADMPVYANKKDIISITQISSMNKADTSNSLEIKMPNHIGTHIDFPSHFCKHGKVLQDYSDDFWFFDKVGFIEATFDNIEMHIKKLDKDIEILLVKTNFEKYRHTSKYVLEQPIIKPELANMIRQNFQNLRVLGFDMISVSSYTNRELGRKAHKSFLCDNDILLLEDMKLKNLNFCPDKIVIAPLMIKNSDGVPCFVYAF